MTVSNVINGWPYITDETRQKVQAAIEALGYRPNALARSLVTGRTKSVGVVIPDIGNPFFGQVVRGCEDVLYSAGYSILLCNTNEDPYKERSYLEMLVSRGIDGLLMFGAHSSSEVLSTIVHDGIPIVAEDSLAQHINTAIINVDNEGGALTATQHLLGLGHSCVGHLAGPPQRLAAQGRVIGYKKALEQANLDFDPALLVSGMPSIRGGYLIAMDLIKTQKPTALFCYNDLMALGAIAACRNLGLRIPRDLALVGFDDITEASFVSPALTTVRIRQYEMGKLASELLLERLAGAESSPGHVLFPVELVIRNSCGARRLSKKQINDMMETLVTSNALDLYPYLEPPCEE